MTAGAIRRYGNTEEDFRALQSAIDDVQARVRQLRQHPASTTDNGDAPSHADLGRRAWLTYHGRRNREKLFGMPGLFADPAYDIMLDLYIQEHRHCEVSISSACIAAAVPATTALRWIEKMCRDGLIERTADDCDRRRFFLRLTAAARDLLERHLMVLDSGQP